MLQGASRGLRISFVLLLVLALAAVSSINAQSTSLTQIAKTLDGEISIRLPEGWMSRDAAASIFTSVLAVGDSATSLQAIVDSLVTPSDSTAPGMNGVIGIVHAELVSGLPSELAISTLLNSLIASAQQAGGQVEQQQSIMLGGQYPATIALVTAAGDAAKGYIGVFQAGANIVEFSIGAAPARSFDASQQMFIDMLDSIRVPAETGSSLPPTAVLATAIPVNQGQNQDTNTAGGAITSSSGTFSFELPEGWSTDTISLPGFGDTVSFGSSDAAVQAITDLFVNGQQSGNFDGVGGFIGAVDTQQLQGQTPETLVSPLMQSILGNIGTDAVQIIEQPAAHTFGGQYVGERALTNLGYIAVMHSGQELLVGVILSNDVPADSDVMSNILESISIPATGAQPVTPEPVPSEEVTVPTPEPVPSEEAVLAESMTFRSSDEQVSLVIPGDWTVLDRIADAQILAFGDSFDAAMSRLYSVKPDVATETVISGNGGVVVLYPMAQFGIDPSNPDLMPLIQRALGNLRGYSVEQEPQPLEGIEGGVIAVINGTENGYLALIPFGDQIAYVTATSKTAFADSESALLDILKSVHVPAVAESGGLGGLGGLLSDATPEATIEPTAPGLAGL